MADKEHDYGSSYNSNFNQSGYLSQLNSKQLVQSHIKSIMPSLKGGKKDNIHYLFVRVYKHLPERMKPEGYSLENQLYKQFGQYLNYKTFKDKSELLEERIDDDCLFYIFVQENLASWAQKFSSQERKESKGKKIIHVVKFLGEENYEIKYKQRKKLKKDPNQKIIYEVNKDRECIDMMNTVIMDMEQRLTLKVKNEGDKVKNWALSNKFAVKKKDKKNLHFYIQDELFDKLQKVKRGGEKRKKWVSYHSFSSYAQIIGSLVDRQDHYINDELGSQIPTSKLVPEKSFLQSNLKSQLNLGSSLNMSSKMIPAGKGRGTLPNDENYIISLQDFPQFSKLSRFVKSRQNWRIFKVGEDQEDKIKSEVDKIISKQAQQEQNEFQIQKQKAISARSLYIFTFDGDERTISKFKNHDNNFCNMDLIIYESPERLKQLLYQYSKDSQNYTIVIIDSTHMSIEMIITDFCAKNKNVDSKNLQSIDNLHIIDKKSKYNSFNSFLGTNSNMNYEFEESAQWLQKVMEERDKEFHPFGGLGGRNVYILYRYDKQYLIDNNFRKYIASSRRLQKATYVDHNYLTQLLSTIKKNDSSIIITDDSCLREAQGVARKFHEVYIMNITERKNVKDEIKVLAWGSKEQIYQHIKSEIKEFQKEKKRQYMLQRQQHAYERPDRQLPKNIEWKTANNICVRFPSKYSKQKNRYPVAHEESETMQNRLDHYFSEEIRFEEYDDPMEIRLTNRKEEPLTFIITDDDDNDLNYMKEIASEEVNDLRQEYILYSKDFKRNLPSNELKIRHLAEKDQYRRFRFFSNNWKNIEQYIIGIYESIKGFGNDSIYVDEEIHVFCHPQDNEYVQYYLKNFHNCPTYRQTHFYTLQEMEEVVSQQSYHHLYYLFVNERDGTMTESEGRNLIESPSIQRWNKNVKMLIAKEDRLNKKENDIKAIHEDGKLSMEFISKTHLKDTPITKSKPYIFYGKNNVHWSYFFDKYQEYANVKGQRRNKNYEHEYFGSNQDLAKRLGAVRTENPGSKIWILLSDKKELAEYSKIAKDIDRGRQIQFIYHGEQPNMQSSMKRENVPIIFSDPNSKEVEAFIRNMFKRDRQVFSPAALRNPPPYLSLSPAMQNMNFPLNKGQMKRWEDDLNAERKDFQTTDKLVQMSQERPVYLLMDSSEQKFFDSIHDSPNIRKIIFDDNINNRNKSHRLTNFNEKKRTLYYGHYPAEIKRYLQNLRYNIKNSPEDLQKKFDKKLTQVYIEEGVELTDEEKQKIEKKNASIVRVKRFSNLNLAIDESQKYPNYNSLFIVKKGTDQMIERHRNKDNIRYITMENNRPYTTRTGDLVTNENPQIVTYLKNLPQKRYDKAKKLQKPLRLYYKKNMPQQNEIKMINSKNKNFVPVEYENISFLKEPGVALVNEEDEKNIRGQGIKQQISYFILGNNNQRDLQPQDQYTYFITRNQKELPGFLKNTQVNRIQQPSNRKPAIKIPTILTNNSTKDFSHPLSEYNYNYSTYQPLKSKGAEEQRKINPIPISIRNKITNDNSNIMNCPSILMPDRATNRQDLSKIRSSMIPVEKPKILSPKLDFPPSFNDNNFRTESDTYNFVQTPPAMPGKKPKFEKLAIIHPDNKEFNHISQTLKNNLDPKYFQVDLLPFKSDYELENYSKPNGQKIIAKYDKVICFLQPNHSKYENTLRSIKSKFNNKLEYYIFEDDFDEYYPSMRRFLDNYVAKQESIPYVNKEDPQFWLSSTLYNVLVPFNKKKKFDSLKRQNVIVTPYKTSEDIFNQIHRQNQFTIIVLQYKDYHKFKVFPRISPRCILVVEDTYPVKEDEVVLHRFPKKALYYGPDAYNYLNKFRIPSKVIPFKQQIMKILFYYENSMEERIASFNEQFHSFEKVPYINNEELFVYLIDRYKSSHNYRMKKITIRPTDLIRLYPKVYMQKLDYHEVYMKDYSQVGYNSIYKKNFKNDIHPKLYSHLPVKYYKNYKDLGKQLENQDSPCLVMTSASEQKMNKVMYQNRSKHLFIQLIDLKDKWIEENGDLTPFDKLAREELATKQILFTRMFSEEVFDTYNDMGYYYLSNKATFDEKRNIKFMTKEALQDHYNKNPNLLMIVFVEYTDLQYIPKPFYDAVHHQMKDDRVKLILLKSNFVHHDEVLYVKFNEIDPVIRHINKVQSSGRVDYCLYPAGELGTLVWHKFVQDPAVKGCESKQFYSLQQIDDIAKQIKGKFKKVYVICEPQDKNYIERKLHEYSIKTKTNSNEEVRFIPIPFAEKKSFLKANSSIIKKSEMIKFPDQEDQYGEKFETVGHAIDIKLNSSNKPSPIGIEEVIENKNFVLSVNEKLKNIFPIGNFYASKVKYFKNFKNLGNLQAGKSQIIISNENLPEIQQITDKNPETFVIYVNNDMQTGKNGNTLIIKEQQIPSLIKKLQGSKENEGESSLDDKLNIKNMEDYKIIKIVYDNGIDRHQKKKIFEYFMKNKNIFPYVFKDMKQIKEFMKEDDSLVVLMMSQDPPELEEELAKENFMAVPKKRAKMLIPRQFDSAIDGLSTILEEQQSEIDYREEKQLTESNLNIYLNMIQKNPEKSKKMLMTKTYSDNDQGQKESGRQNHEQDHEHITKLDVHSYIRPQTYLDEQQIYKIRQRLDGGVIVVVVEKKYTRQIKDILKNYNILIQQYSHAVNLDQSIRDRKDKVTIVVIQKNMLESIIPIKTQFPRLIFILLKEVNEEVPEKYHRYISGEINIIPDIEKIIGEIHEENERIKYSDQIKGQSRFDQRRVSTVDVGNSERFYVGFNNTRAKKAFIFYKDPENLQIKNRLSDTLTNITFISYKNLTEIQKKLSNYGGYQSILIANNQDIYEIQDYVAKKKEQIYIIRYDPPRQISANPKVKLLFTATSEEDLYTYLARQFHKNQFTSERTLTSKLNPKKSIPEGKKYVQKYDPSSFGTTPRFSVDFVPPKNKESTYSSRYLKSTSKTSRILKNNGRSIDSRSIESPYYN